MYNETIHNRLNNLRNAMKIAGVNYYLFTSADFHNSEYTADYFKSREYFSGFNGSNGDLLVWEDGAALWTDGRYFLQAKEQLEGTGIELMKMGIKGVPTVEEFLVKNMLPGQSIGTDGRCIPINRGLAIEKALDSVRKKACADAENPYDSKIIWNIDLSEKVWCDRPALPSEKAWLLDEIITGESRRTRLQKVRDKMDTEKAECLVLSSLDDIAWLTLLRGGDIEYNPVVLSYMIVLKDKAYLYVNKNSFTDEIINELAQDGIELRDYKDVQNDLAKINENISEHIFDKIDDLGVAVNDSKEKEKEKIVWIDPDRLSYSLYKCLENDEIKLLKKPLPTVIMKAKKTKQEVENEKFAHIKDGVAVTKLLYQLELIRNDEEFLSGKRKITELEVADMLLKLRMEQEDFIEQSFAPIIATGAHGAIIHYEPDEKSNANIEPNKFLLMDTGAQFLQGTTDITRTVMMGEPTQEEKANYTAVLCGNLELANAYFPEGTTGPNLDILARKALWKRGLDYRHGTGHGVGFLLNVHEGPQNISQRARLGKLGTPFEEGMITSDEPGVYIDGQYGIRLENMMVCKKCTETEYGAFYDFETLTMVPFDRRCIDLDIMSQEEKEMLNQYHQKVYKTLSPFLTEDERKWLENESSPI